MRDTHEATKLKHEAHKRSHKSADVLIVRVVGTGLSISGSHDWPTSDRRVRTGKPERLPPGAAARFRLGDHGRASAERGAYPSVRSGSR